MLSCEEDEVFDLSYKAPEVSLDFQPQVGAYYRYNLDSLQATIATYRSPANGYYNSFQDFDRINQQITQSRNAGVDFWIFNSGDRSGPLDGYPRNIAYTSDSIITTFKNNVPSFSTDIQYLIRYTQNHEVNEPAGFLNLENGLKAIVDNHFSDQNYFKIDNKPVLILVNNLLEEQMEPSDDPMPDPRVNQLETLRANLEAYAGTEIFFILDIIGFNPPQRNYDISRWADAVTGTRVYSGQNSISLDRYNLAYEQTFKNWKETLMTDTLGTPVIPSATLGRNDTTTYFLMNEDGELEGYSNDTWVLGGTTDHFRDQLKIAKSIVEPTLPIIMVETWNDWFRGDAIEPSQQNGEDFINVLIEEL
jgi:hypothetical protein